MKRLFQCAVVVLLLSALNSRLATVLAQGTAFSYQGQLYANGALANGLYDFRFKLAVDKLGDTDVGAPFLTNAIPVTNGLFITAINFGTGLFNGSNYWLEVDVRTNNPSNMLGYTSLVPLQAVTPTPYAIFANTASNVSGTIQVAQLSGTVPLAQLPVAVVTNNESSVTLSNVTLTGTLNLPSAGTVNAGGRSLLYADGAEDFYAGPGAGSVAISASDSTGIGYGSLSSNSNGANNTAIGYLSLNSNTNGSFNVASGGRALFSNTSGNNNVAYGRRALENNTTGSDNTADGFEALSANPVGSQNVAVGSGALQNSTNDSELVAIGYQALENDSAIDQGPSGYGENTAVGYQALQANNFGFANTALGYLALAVNTNGVENTAIGDNALPLNTSGSQNTVVGAISLYAITYGFDNTVCGDRCMNANSAGGYNTALGFAALNGIAGQDQGYGSGTNINNNTAVGCYSLYEFVNGSNNIALGYLAGGNLLSGSNNIYIGNQGNESGIESGITRIGTTGQQTITYLAGNVALDNTLIVDRYGLNNGTLATNALVFGAGTPFSGEGIASKRTSGGTQHDLEFYTDYTNRMTILNGGEVGIGTTAPDALLSVNGSVDKPGGGSWGTFSDARLKDVGPDFTHGLEALKAIQPVHYHYKSDNALNLPSQPDYVGVVAQQVQSAIPEAVHQNRDGYLVVNNDPIIWTMFNAIKELNQKREAEDQAKDAEIQQLKAKADKVDALEKQLNDLEAMVKTLAEKK